jgi:hypothetical protein
MIYMSHNIMNICQAQYDLENNLHSKHSYSASFYKKEKDVRNPLCGLTPFLFVINSNHPLIGLKPPTYL